ncbi:arginine ABC transporter substrate-binding protein [Gemella sp. ND 6198]|uniref:transporter substrate-binding domain-containing protein n=1 Tax=Gemella sp. ND 6198 TaxID=2040624 RepID=UPI000E0B5881|nr:transporter substrate-binding domain-containing protein [Gemella sp. ND 6198]AXI27232.1 arginine ABC transporter substrate-binding protein [Gemella sp. ND 6198]
MKKLLLFITALMTIITLTACSKSNSKTKVTEIKDKGKIVLGVSPDYPPYEFLTTENGQKKVVGADIYLAQEVAKKLGVEVEIQEMVFDSLIAALNANKVDMVISGVNPTDERKKAVDFSDIYYTSKGIFVVNKDSEEIKSSDDLKNKKVGVQKGSTYETYVKEQLKLDDKNIQALTDVPSLLQDLKNKKIDVVLIPDDVAKIAMNKYSDIKISTFAAENDPEATGMAIAFKKGNDNSNKELLEQVNAVIKEIQAKKLFEQELDKYAKIAAKSE